MKWKPSPEHAAMRDAKSRCENINHQHYERYGKRGIKFNFPSVLSAREWIVENLGNRPDGHCIDRINNDGHYEPGNLKWSCLKESVNNSSVVKLVNLDGITFNTRDAAKLKGINKGTISTRMSRNGLSRQEAAERGALDIRNKSGHKYISWFSRGGKYKDKGYWRFSPPSFKCKYFNSLEEAIAFKEKLV